MRWLTDYWGKARPIPAFGPRWHPLAYHSLDVAACMLAMLAARPAWLEAVAAASGSLAREEARLRLVVVAALHDLGKFADNFQQKVPEVREALQPDLAQKRSLDGHGDVGAAMLDQWSGRPRRLQTWLLAAFAHHGAPVRDPRVPTQAIALDDAMSEASRSDAFAFADTILDLIGQPDDSRARGGEWLVAGLVVLADWIGSNQEAWFPYADPVLDLAAYWDLAQARARKAVSEAGLAEAAVATGLDLDVLLQTPSIATPLQAWAAAEAPDTGPHLYILEDFTGAGKTEAALLLAHRLMRAGAGEGLYWALPTVATSNALYGRLEHAYRRLFAEGSEPSLALAHSARDLHAGFQASIGRAGDSLYGPDRPAGLDGQDISAEAACAAFVADDRKKTFLAEVGVGTVDQALLSVLPVRHQSLRLAALCRRVLVIDEVHAYAPYEARAVERLLDFHARHGGSAIVLSATLTRAQRRRLAGIYDRSCAEAVLEAAYPLVTRVSGGAVSEQPLQAAPRGGRRDLPVRRFDTPEDVEAELLARAPTGACGVYVRNTVTDAMETFGRLRAMAPEGVRVDLFHSRFTLGDREAIERRVLAAFGKSSAPADRAGRILVATQVVEQSLDLDLDYMATDLCPMDLLIQRAGRLHRHVHRPARPGPELWVVGPPAADDADRSWYERVLPKASRVYPDASQLWRTLRLLETDGLRLATKSPRDLIEAVFGEDPPASPESLEPTADKAAGDRLAHRAIADLNLLKPDRFDRQGGRWEPEDRTPTRLADPSHTFRLARWVEGRITPWCEGGPHAWRRSEIQVPARLFVTAEPPTPQAAAAVETLVAGWPERYEAPGVLLLEAESEAGVWRAMVSGQDGQARAAAYSREAGLQVEKA
ncbi:CRISPR-associated helicase Cas3' [Phenylobacterium sp.]|uniref:CRISPR-associated helicase Cas3' n=1 Tax=Phenylobacterium sp. TaxID=1871053 RepID=UPI00301D4248